MRSYFIASLFLDVWHKLDWITILKHGVGEYAWVNMVYGLWMISKDGLWVVNDEFGMFLACIEYRMIDYKSYMELVLAWKLYWLMKCVIVMFRV